MANTTAQTNKCAGNSDRRGSDGSCEFDDPFVGPTLPKAEREGSTERVTCAARIDGFDLIWLPDRHAAALPPVVVGKGAGSDR